MITAYVNYGLIQKDQDYVLVAEGPDWYRVRVKGKSICVFKWVFEHEQRNRS